MIIVSPLGLSTWVEAEQQLIDRQRLLINEVLSEVYSGVWESELSWFIMT
jgi:hypothetical protein